MFIILLMLSLLFLSCYCFVLFGYVVLPPYPCHLQLGAQSFNTNSSTQGKLHCIFPFFDFFFLIAVSFCCCICSVIIIIIIIPFCVFFSLCNYNLINMFFFARFFKLKTQIINFSHPKNPYIFQPYNPQSLTFFEKYTYLIFFKS